MVMDGGPVISPSARVKGGQWVHQKCPRWWYMRERFWKELTPRAKKWITDIMNAYAQKYVRKRETTFRVTFNIWMAPIGTRIRTLRYEVFTLPYCEDDNPSKVFYEYQMVNPHTYITYMFYLRQGLIWEEIPLKNGMVLV
jgi:hypothetical protein